MWLHHFIDLDGEQERLCRKLPRKGIHNVDDRRTRRTYVETGRWIERRSPWWRHKRQDQRTSSLLEVRQLGLENPITIEDNLIQKDMTVATVSAAVYVRLTPSLPNALSSRVGLPAEKATTRPLTSST